MHYPRRSSTATNKRKPHTAPGYPTLNCRASGGRFDARTGTPSNAPGYRAARRALALRYKLSFRDVAETLVQRGDAVTHETVRAWEFPFEPLLPARLRARRRGRAGVSWYTDETSVKVTGRA